MMGIFTSPNSRLNIVALLCAGAGLMVVYEDQWYNGVQAAGAR